METKREEIKTLAELKQALEELLKDYSYHKINKNDMRNSLKNLLRNYTGEEPLWIERILKQVSRGEIPLRECILQIEKLEFALGNS